MYEPLQISLQNFAALIATDTQCERMDEILYHPEQTGIWQLSNDGYDIEFKNVKFSYEEGEAVLRDVSFVAEQGSPEQLHGTKGVYAHMLNKQMVTDGWKLAFKTLNNCAITLDKLAHANYT